MPKIKSAKKALRQSLRRRANNLAKTTAYKMAVKKFRKFVADGKFDDAAKFLPTVYQKIDKAAKTGVIKKNKAARLKSGVAHALKPAAK